MIKIIDRECSVSPSTYHSRSLILDHLAKFGPVRSWGVAFGKLPVNLALERTVTAKQIASGGCYTYYVQARRLHVCFLLPC